MILDRDDFERLGAIGGISVHRVIVDGVYAYALVADDLPEAESCIVGFDIARLIKDNEVRLFFACAVAIVFADNMSFALVGNWAGAVSTLLAGQASRLIGDHPARILSSITEAGLRDHLHDSSGEIPDITVSGYQLTSDLITFSWPENVQLYEE